jgi:hypothetical protein
MSYAARNTSEQDHQARRGRQPAAQREERADGGSTDALLQSPRALAQRQALDTAFGPAQRAGAEEELLQGKFGTAQRVGPEEELPVQGRFATAQRAGVEEELPLQGRFATVQRVEDEELLQGRFDTAQRVEEEELLQGRFATAPVAQAKAEPAGENRTGMPDALKSGVESLSGMDMSDVRVHRNSSQPAQLNALAYAQGNDIHLAPGQEQHLPHEAWHVVQQRQGRVQPTMQLAGTAVNDDVSLETEADVMGAKALAQPAAAAAQLKPMAQSLPTTAQRAVAQMGGGDKYYWVVNHDTGDKQYVGAFKNHATANSWWADNKSSWAGYEFAQGSTKTKFK